MCVLGLMQGPRLGRGYLYLLSHLSVSMYCKFGIDSSSSIFSLSLSLSQAWLPNSIHASRKSLHVSTHPTWAYGAAHSPHEPTGQHTAHMCSFLSGVYSRTANDWEKIMKSVSNISCFCWHWKFKPFFSYSVFIDLLKVNINFEIEY